MKAKQIDSSQEEYEEYLRDLYGDVDICGISCDAVDALKLVDETSFYNGYSNYKVVNKRWECAGCDDIFNNEQDANTCCGYACPMCDNRFDNIDDASKCCKHINNPMPTHSI